MFNKVLLKISRASAHDLYNSGADIFYLPEGLPIKNKYFPPMRVSNICGKTFDELDESGRKNLCLDSETGTQLAYFITMQE